MEKVPDEVIMNTLASIIYKEMRKRPVVKYDSVEALHEDLKVAEDGKE